MNSPYFGFPYYNRYSRYGYRYPYYNNLPSNNSVNNTNNKACENNKSYNVKEKPQNNSFSKINSNNNSTNCNNEDIENPMFEIFGIKLFFDDILIICLIFFLYKEEVKDQSLFVALILLLLSQFKTN